jgi:hypothetical protein
MKTLIENSIKILTVPGPMKTIFTPEQTHPRYISLLILVGKEHRFSFTCAEDSEEHSNQITLNIPALTTEEEIKQFIIDEINKIII